LNNWSHVWRTLNEEKVRLHCEFRDALLPDLMTGKIDVSQTPSYDEALTDAGAGNKNRSSVETSGSERGSSVD